MVNTTILSVNTIFHFLAEWIQCRAYDQYFSNSNSTGVCCYWLNELNFFIDIHILFPNCKFFVYMTYVQLFIIISFIIWKTFLGVLFHLIVKLSTDFTVFPDFDKELTRNVTNQQRLLIPQWHHNYL